MASGPMTSWQIEGEKVKVVTNFFFLGSKITADGDCSHEIRRWLLLGRNAMINLDSMLKSRDITLLTKVCTVKAMVFPCNHVRLWEPDHKEGRAPKNWCLQTVVLEKTPESLLESEEIKLINLKGNQPWIFIGKTDAEAPVFWSSDMNSWLIGKVPDAGTDWGQKKRVSEDERAGWHHWCNEQELRQTLGDGEGQGGLVCCSPWSHKQLDTTKVLNSNNKDHIQYNQPMIDGNSNVWIWNKEFTEPWSLNNGHFS